jgi:hypothetical protein
LHLHRVLAVAAVAATFLAPAPARGDRERRVGLVVTIAVNVTPEEAQELAAELGEQIRRALPIDVIAGSETVRRLPPAGLPEECVGDVSCRNDLGRRLDADELLLLAIVRMGDVVQIDTTWANVASGRTASRPRIEIAASADRARLFAAAAPGLLPQVAAEAKASRTGSGQVVVIEKPGQPEDGRRMTAPAWIAAGVGAGALATGVILALSARSKFDALDGDDCRTTQCEQDRIDTGRRHALYADVMFGTALAGGTTALVLYLVSGASERDPRPPAVSATGSSDSFGLLVRGRF